jgi:hypothetical protein
MMVLWLLFGVAFAMLADQFRRTVRAERAWDQQGGS